MKTAGRYDNPSVDIAQVNRLARDPAALIAFCEEQYHAQIATLTRRVAGAGGRYRVLLLAGPSSSGKTTTAHKLSKSFDQMGICAPVVSLDDFFMGMENYPRLPDGTPDMESVEALDLPLINRTLQELIETGDAWFPTFDFLRSRRASEENHIVLGQNGILILEGLHALNPRMVEMLDSGALFHAYVSTRTRYTDGDRPVLCPRDARLIRRMVRDHNFRGRLPVDTLLTWDDVLSGEEKHIYPYRDSVDFAINSSHDYEGCVFHHYILPMLEPLKDNRVCAGKIREIAEILEAFDDIDHHHIPPDSLLREFIG
jgi:uridine kinase